MNQADVSYSGFVYSDVPSPKTAQTIFKLFTKRGSSSKTRPNMFHRIFDGHLTLSVAETGLTLLTVEKTRFMHVPISKVYFAHSIQRTLLVFTRRSSSSKRSDDSTSFKCHVIVFESPDHSEAAAEHLTRLISSFGFRRQSMSMVSRPSSMASTDSLYDPASLPPSVMSSAVNSAVQSPENSGDEGEGDERSKARHCLPDAHTLQAHLSRAFQSNQQPCGVCRGSAGHNWIAFKSCGHEFHLSCAADWRWSHNLCPVCPVPISRTSATLRFLGSCFVEGDLPSNEEMYATAYDNKTATTMRDCVRLQVSEDHLTLYDRLGNTMRECSKHASHAVHSVTVMNAILVLAVREGPSCLVLQFFESPDFLETDVIFPIIKQFCL